MRVRFWSAVAAALTISTGLVILLGLLITESVQQEVQLPAGSVETLGTTADVLLRLATITVALTVIIGVLNLLAVHLGRIVSRSRGAIYSLVLLVSFGIVVGTYVLARDTSMVILEQVQLSVESALAGVLFFALVYGAYRMMRDRVTWYYVLFVTALLVVLLAALPFDGLGVIQGFRDWLLAIPVSAGARGLLLGIALAVLVTGIRILIGLDRSYRE